MTKEDWRKFLVFWLLLLVGMLLMTGLDHLLRELSGGGR